MEERERDSLPLSRVFFSTKQKGCYFIIIKHSELPRTQDQKDNVPQRIHCLASAKGLHLKGCLGVTGHVERLPLLALPLTLKWRKQAKGADVEAFVRPEQMYKGLLKENSVKRSRDIRGKFRDTDRDQQTETQRETCSLRSNQVFCNG